MTLKQIFQLRKVRLLMRPLKILNISLLFGSFSFFFLFLYAYTGEYQDWLGLLVSMLSMLYFCLCLIDTEKFTLSVWVLYPISTGIFMWDFLLSLFLFQMPWQDTVGMRHIQLPISWIFATIAFFILVSIFLSAFDLYISNKKYVKS